MKSIEIKLSAFALAAGLGFAPMAFGTSAANAADLGGDCCADLEERVAELEATTVRKGNRKVSVKISGHVSQAVMFWDDGFEENAYVVNNAPSESRFRLTGAAKIGRGWSAGYRFEFGVRGNAGGEDVDQFTDDAGGNGIGVRKSEMYIKHDKYGKVTIGQGSPALDDLTHFGSLLGSYDQPGANWGASFFLRDSGGAVSDIEYSDVATDFDESRRNVVRYDTPAIAGFVLSTAWGEDDYWDVALRYAGTLGDFKVKAAVGYLEDTDTDNTAGGDELDQLKASALVWHTPTGLFVAGAYADFDPEGGQEHEGYMVQAGIKRKFIAHGYTTIWGSYYQNEDKGIGGAITQNALDTGAASFTNSTITNSEIERFRVGIVQDIDAAALQLFMIYENTEFDVDTVAGDFDAEDLDLFLIGGKISF